MFFVYSSHSAESYVVRAYCIAIKIPMNECMVDVVLRLLPKQAECKVKIIEYHTNTN